jgi:hypothetical protein
MSGKSGDHARSRHSCYSPWLTTIFSAVPLQMTTLRHQTCLFPVNPPVMRSLLRWTLLLVIIFTLRLSGQELVRMNDRLDIDIPSEGRLRALREVADLFEINVGRPKGSCWACPKSSDSESGRI